MNEKLKQILFLCLIIVPILSVIYGPSGDIYEGPDSLYIVPFYGLHQQVHMFVHLIIMPLVMSCLLVLIIPILFTPLFLLFKKIAFRKFKDGFIDLPEKTINLRKFFIRGIFIFLLLMGLTETLLDANLIDVRVFLSPFQIGNANNTNMEYRYDLNAYFGVIMLLLPLVIGLWGVAWVMDDAGLLHYKLPGRDSKKHFEIEPTHLKYSVGLKVFAGVSTLLFFIGNVSYYITYTPDNFSNIFFVTITGLETMFLAIPAYLIYWNFLRPRMRKYLIKNLKEVERITEITFKS